MAGGEEAWSTMRRGPKTSQLRDSRPCGSCAKLTCGVNERIGCKAAMESGGKDQGDVSCVRNSCDEMRLQEKVEGSRGHDK